MLASTLKVKLVKKVGINFEQALSTVGSGILDY
jgi:hypothetical protein